MQKALLPLDEEATADGILSTTGLTEDAFSDGGVWENNKIKKRL